MEANKSFYDSVVRLVAFFFAVAVFIILKEGQLNSWPVVVLFLIGLGIYSILIIKKRQLIDNSEKLYPLRRSGWHILVDSINETCRISALSVALLASRDDFRFFEQPTSKSFTIQALIIIFLIISYMSTIIYYSFIGKDERKKFD